MNLTCSAKQARDDGLGEMERGVLSPESSPFLALAPAKTSELPALGIQDMSPPRSNRSLFMFLQEAWMDSQPMVGTENYIF